MDRLQQSIGQLAVARPAWGRVLERLGVDFSLRERRSLADICRSNRLDPAVILDEIANEDLVEAELTEHVQEFSLSRLCDHLLESHHRALHREFPRLNALLERVADMDGSMYPELRQAREAFAEFEADLKAHLHKEETVLFPFLKRLEAAHASPTSVPHAHAHPLNLFEAEHEKALNQFRHIRRILTDFSAPADATFAHRALLSSLEKLETDLRILIWKENEILYPRANRYVEERVMSDVE